MNRKEKICLVNAHWSNHGDEAAIIAIIRIIQKIKPNADITLLIKDKKNIKGEIIVDGQKIFHESIQFLPQIWDYIIQLMTNGIFGKNPKMRRLIWYMKTSDYIIYAPGGSVINDRFWWKKQLEYLLPFFYAKRFHKLFYVASPSIGPFQLKYKFRNRIRGFIFNHTENLYVRENISCQYLESISAGKTVKQTVDSAFCDDTDLKSQEKKLLKDIELCEFMSRYKKIVGITITELDWNVKYKEQPEIVTNVKKMAQEFIKRLNQEAVGVILIPQLFGNQDDKSILMKYQGENTFILNEDYNSDFQQYLISRLYMMIGFRYHSNIFAAKAGTPFLPIIYEEKMEGFIKDTALSKYAITVERMNDTLLWEKYQLIESEYESYKKRLKKENVKWLQAANITKESIAKFLK